MKERRRVSAFFCVSLLLLILSAASNLLFGFHIFEISGLLSYFPYQERVTSTEGVRAVIMALGTVCFVLSYINSAKGERVKGILMEEVISHCYPYYGCIFFFHGCFAALGLYSSAVGALRAAYICLLGIVACLIYSLRMAYQVCFSPKARNKLVGQYITDLLLHPLGETSTRISRAYQFGQYVGTQYNAYDIRLDKPICRNKKAENTILSMMGLLMLKDEPDVPLPEAFPHIFSDADAQLPQNPQYILFSLPGYDGYCKKFQKDIQSCSILWENILSKVQTEERQAAFVGEALLCSTGTAVLSCGLVHYFLSNYVQYRTEQKDWSACAHFIARISNYAKKAGSQFAPEGQKKVSLCCRDMSVLFLCLAFLEEANSPETCLETEILAQLRSEQYANRSLDFCIYWDDQRLLRYLSFAYEIFLSLASPGIRIPCRTEMHLQVHAILQKLQQCLNAK